jgi:DMSO/TMAO reductase YedYZ molybdopterin-dependent catalytic subunit
MGLEDETTNNEKSTTLLNRMNTREPLNPDDKLNGEAIHITPTHDFFSRQYSSITPSVVSSDWRLRIDGMVKDKLTISLDEIHSLPQMEYMRTLECIGNPPGGPLIGNAIWKGVPMRHLIERLDFDGKPTRAKFYAADGYTTAVDMKWILSDNTILAYEMNGHQLSDKLGFPIRVLIPGLYGQKMPKWIDRIEFIDHNYLGFWEEKGWSDVAEVLLKSHISSPRNTEQLHGEVQIAGIAYGGDFKTVTNVEVRYFDGRNWTPWIPTRITRSPSPAAWTEWVTSWKPPSEGVYGVEVRATDQNGNFQTSHSVDGDYNTFPNGSNEIHRVNYIITNNPE